MNDFDPDLKFLFEKLTTDINSLHINIKTVDNQLYFDNFYKSTNSFSYLKYNSCYPSDTKNNLSLLLARRIIGIVTDNCDYRLEESFKEKLPREQHELFLYKKLSTYK